MIARALLAAALLAAAPVRAAPPGDQLGADGLPFDGAVGKSATLRSVKWQINALPVCWENPLPDHARQRQQVRAAIAGSWERVANVRFVGWGTCAPGQRAVRVAVGPGEWPRAAIGNLALSTRTSVWLNFDLKSYAGFRNCATKEDRCEQFIAIHEFGHVLGLLHEQDRPDASAECLRSLAPGQSQRYDSAELVTMTAYDPDSVMNYCNRDRWNPNVPLSLTRADAAGVVALFGAPTAVAEPRKPEPGQRVLPRFVPTTGPIDRTQTGQR